jgi:Fe-S-cluster containining protein
MRGKNMSDDDFFSTCSRCEINCCREAKPPITHRRREIIEESLKSRGISAEDLFGHKDYLFPREDAEGYCTFYNNRTRRCQIHPVKPETCVAGPVTFDLDVKNRKIEWYLKMEEICPLAGVMYQEKEELSRHFRRAKKEIFRLVRELDPMALQAILKIEEPKTFKIGEDDIEEDVLTRIR